MDRPDIAVLCSGGGSNLQALIDRIDRGDLRARIAWTVSNNGDSGALERARMAGIPAHHVSARTEGSDEAVARRLLGLVEAHDVRLLVLAGYMKPLAGELLERLPGRVVNIHPSLLPAFGGPGMYGRRIHEAVLRRGAKYTGVTVHQVTERYDEGPILAQRVVAVRPGDTTDSLAARVLRVEHDLLWRVVRDLLPET